MDGGFGRNMDSKGWVDHEYEEVTNLVLTFFVLWFPLSQ
jgi:hypothetical protein